VELGNVNLDALIEADPAIKEQVGTKIKGAIDARFKADKKAKPVEPPPAPVVPPEMEAELAELREYRQKREDAEKTEAQKQVDAAARAVKNEEKRQRDEAAKLKAEQDRAAAAEAKLRDHMLDTQIVAWLSAKNKGIGVAHIPTLIRSNFKEVEGKFVAESPETGAMVGVDEFLAAYLKQPGNEPFLPPPVPGSGVQPGGRPGAKPPENLTPGQQMTRAIAEKLAGSPVAAGRPVFTEPAESQQGTPQQ
jgi:hypothetical protein